MTFVRLNYLCFSPCLLLSFVIFPILVACNSSLNLRQLETTIKEEIKSQTGLSVETLTCPSQSRTLAANDTFNCEAKTQEGMLTVEVNQADNKGNINWKVTRGLFSLKTAEQELQKAIERKTGIKLTVDCGSQNGASRIAQPGKTFDCQVTDGKQTLPLKITLEDDEGAFHWEPVRR